MMKIEGLLTDEAILTELGGRLAQHRLEIQLTQEMLAEQAGVSKRTVERIEAGATTQISTLIRILRVLELLDRLETLVPEAGPLVYEYFFPPQRNSPIFRNTVNKSITSPVFFQG